MTPLLFSIYCLSMIAVILGIGMIYEPKKDFLERLKNMEEIPEAARARIKRYRTEITLMTLALIYLSLMTREYVSLSILYLIASALVTLYVMEFVLYRRCINQLQTILAVAQPHQLPQFARRQALPTRSWRRVLLTGTSVTVAPLLVLVGYFGIQRIDAEITGETLEYRSPFLGLAFRETSLTESGDSFVIDSPEYRYVFAKSDIVGTDLIDELPSNKKICECENQTSGRYEIDGIGEATVCVYPESPPYVVIRLKEKNLVLNARTPAETRAFYIRLANAL